MYTRLRDDLSSLIKTKDCGPLLLRLSWHDAGTFCLKTNTGGAHAVMRFSNSPEACDKANLGLDKARALLEPLKVEYREVGYADLWSLAAVVAIEVMGGPVIPWKPGRKDADSHAESVEVGRLPNAEKGCSHLRRVFGRMDFTDKDIVALSGAHTVGANHPERSGYDGSWTTNPLTFDNSYFKELLKYSWMPTPGRTGCTIFKPVENPTLAISMLPSDIALLNDESTLKWVKLYAENQEEFFSDFKDAFIRLQEASMK